MVDICDIIFILTGMQVTKLTYPEAELIQKYGIPPYRNKFIVTPPNGTLDSNNSIDILLWMLVATWCSKIPKFYTLKFPTQTYAWMFGTHVKWPAHKA